jgi:DNA-binding NarL/FixJ family response regulator
VRGKPEFQSLSIIVFSSSDDPRDVERAYELGATSYFVKSVSSEELIHYLRVSV